MKVNYLTPILNVASFPENSAWFEKLGWKKAWDWGDPPTFGAVCCGKVEIFLWQGAQGCRGGPTPPTRGRRRHRRSLDELVGPSACRSRCRARLGLRHGMTVTHPPTNEVWGVREFHLRHPDGHTFRVSAGTEETATSGAEDE